MIYGIDLEDMKEGDNILVSVRVERIIRHPDGRTTVRYAPHSVIVPTEITYRGNPSFEASTYPLKLT